MNGRAKDWIAVCAEARKRPNPTADEARRFFEAWFEPESTRGREWLEGRVTGYFEPIVEASLRRTARFRYPIYAMPRAAAARALARTLSRAEIDGPKQPLAGQEILWLADPLDRYFLHVEGSGTARLPDGSIVGLDYAGQNGKPFRPIGRVLADLGAFPRAKASVPGIRAWLKAHPERVDEILGRDPSYVFFERRREAKPGALGSLGTVLTPRRSIAVDPRFLPLGSVAWLETTVPGSDRPLRSLVFAQDIGGAIKGAGRVDLYWGVGDEAARAAGLANERGRLRRLVPRSTPRAIGKA
jgi:membrane-bound lytic murein transglycosylase A